jgi:hypothetical protein
VDLLLERVADCGCGLVFGFGWGAGFTIALSTTGILSPTNILVPPPDPANAVAIPSAAIRAVVANRIRGLFMSFPSCKPGITVTRSLLIILELNRHP